MANTNRPNGFSVDQTLTPAPFNQQINAYYVPASDATAIGIGDLVKLTTGSTAPDGATQNSGKVLKNVILAGASDVPVGVVVGFQFDPNNLMQKSRLASTGRVVMVADSPSLVLEAQADATGISLANVGLNCTWTPGAPGSLSGNSTSVVTGPASTSTLPFQILGISSVQGNEPGAYARVTLRFNKHAYVTGTTGV